MKNESFLQPLFFVRHSAIYRFFWQAACRKADFLFFRADYNKILGVGKTAFFISLSYYHKKDFYKNNKDEE